MSLNTKVGSFQVTTGAVNATQSITGVGFQPTIVLFWSTGRTEAVDTIGRQTQSSMFGFGISSSKRGVIANFDTDNASGTFSPNYQRGQRNDSCVAHVGVGFLGALDLVSMDSDGFTLKVGIQYVTAYTVHFLALGGPDIQADGGFVAPPTTNTTLSVTSMSFKPNFLMLGFAAGGSSNPGFLSGNSQFMLGMASGSGATQQAVVVSFGFALNPGPRANCYGATGFVLGMPNNSASGGSLQTKATFTSFDAAGWTITFTANNLSSGLPLMWIGLNVGTVAVGGTSTSASTGNFAVTGLSFSPTAVLALSHCLAQSSGSTVQVGGSRSIGAFTSSSNRGAEASQIQDGAGSPSNVGDAVEFDKVYANISSTNTIQGAADAVSMDSAGFTLNQTTGDPQANFLAYAAFGGIPSFDKVHNVDVFVGSVDKVHSVDVCVQAPISKSHNVDVHVLEFRWQHRADVHVQAFGVLYAKLAGQILFPINPNSYLKLAGTIAGPSFQFVKLASTLKGISRSFVNLAGFFQVKTRSYVKLAGTLTNDKLPKHNVDVSVAVPARNFVSLAATLVAKTQKGLCGSFPDATFVNLGGWLVNPGTDSIQMPGAGYTKVDDWSSSSDAVASYKPGSRITIFGWSLPPQGISIIITAFTAGVISNQTRTRTWLRRVDAAPSGILLSTETNTHVLPNGQILTTTTQKKQVQDTLVTIITVKDSGTPARVSTVVTEKTGSGQTTTREIETNTIGGTVISNEIKNVSSQPPMTDNIQPLSVRTLDGVIHYQFFDQVNQKWAGGEQEGKTVSTKSVKTIPGALNGSSTDTSGNNIFSQITDEVVTDPSGKILTTHIEEIGTRKDIGTVTTDTNEQFSGIQKHVTKTVTYPDGSKTVTDTSTNSITGDQVETSTENVTDEFGQTTTTITTSETKTFTDAGGAIRQTTTKNVSVSKNGVTTTDTTTVVNDDFEDDIINQKVKVYYVQEFTITCVIDEMNMEALAEINMTHQKNYALLELFGQQLGNGNLSYNLRQKLIKQFNQANACLLPVTMQALGRQYSVVFAQSASAFREKYIVGTEPHVYELQMILQARSDLINGTFGN